VEQCVVAQLTLRNCVNAFKAEGREGRGGTLGRSNRSRATLPTQLSVLIRYLTRCDCRACDPAPDNAGGWGLAC
jgi:hypothetical protein